MGNGVAAVRDLLDQGVLWTLVPLGFYILFTGLDDLFIDVVWFYFSLRGMFFGHPRVALPSEKELAANPEKRIAIFVPLWHEHQVIGQMLSYNIAAIRYQSYDFFVGAYPNDAPTLDAVQAAEARFPNVHLAVCPHDGPTSKADCLNWIYQRMLLFEESSSVRFEVMMTHDAEDIIHTDSLRWVNHFSDQYGFVQIPVLALSTPPLNFTHGVYCDEFAEFQTRDLPVRNFLGGFLPSAGVGTSYSREALEALANSASNRVFEPVCLTEDYENGYRLHALGIRQLIVPITFRGTFVATREYFPRRMRAAIRQRTRWTTGIALQGWERHGWGDSGQLYWLWRDRRGLLANPISLMTNAVCAYAISTQIWQRISPPPYLLQVLAATLALQLIRTCVRIGCTARVYGFAFSLLSPARVVVANIINSTAVVKAIYRYTRARIRGEALVWVKTEHAYPSRAALVHQRRLLGEILIGSAYLQAEDLEAAIATKPAALRLGEHLIAMGKLSEEDLYEALSLQQQLPLATVDARTVPLRVARALPAHVAAQWKVLPFRIESGRLDVASPELPVDAMERALRGHTALEVRFHLITPMRYRELQQRSV